MLINQVSLLVRRQAQRIKDLLKKGAFRFGTHSEYRTQDRMITEMDIMSVGKTASTVKSYEDGRWKVVGLDEDACEIKVICRSCRDGESLFIISVIDEF